MRRCSEKFNLNWDRRCLPRARYIPPSKNSITSHPPASEISKVRENEWFSFELKVGEFQRMWIRNIFLMWKIHNSRKFHSLWQRARFPWISLECVGEDDSTRTIDLYFSSRGVRLEWDGSFVKNPKKFGAVGFCKILWWTFSMIFVPLCEEHFRNRFIAFNSTDNLVTGCGKTRTRSLGAKSVNFWIGGSISN